MLEVRNLHATIAGKEILKGINLTINDGEIHAIMGPNGSGKSTLSAVLTGNPLYTVTEGEALFNGQDLLQMKPEDRACAGLFLSFQYPVEIPGVSMTNFMRAAINAKREYEGKEPLNAADFLKLMREKRKLVDLDSKLAHRSVNEVRRNEMKYFKWLCYSRSSVFSMKQTPDLMSMPCELWPMVSIKCTQKRPRLS